MYEIKAFTFAWKKTVNKSAFNKVVKSAIQKNRFEFSLNLQLEF